MAIKISANTFILFAFICLFLLVQDSVSLMTRKMMQKKYQNKSCDTDLCSLYPNDQLNITTQCNPVNLSA